MNVLAAACLLIHAGHGGSRIILEVDRHAIELAHLCGDDGDPPGHPSGFRCMAMLAAIWATETHNGYMTVFPRTGSGCGPLQVVQPRRCWRNNRIGTVCGPPCTAMRQPAVGMAWGLWVLRIKHYRAHGSLRLWFRAYNASGTADAYSIAAVRTYERIVTACRR